MTIPACYLLLPILLPVAAGLLIACLPRLDTPKVRTPLTLMVLAAEACALLPILLSGEQTLTLFTLSDTLPITLHTDGLGKVFAMVMAFMWAEAGAYSFDYMAHEGKERRFYAFYLITLGVLMGLCFSASIITFYMFYEAMTLLTFPLVMHSGHKDAVAAGIKYLIYSMIGASLVLLGVFILAPYVDTFSFIPGGVLNADKVLGHEALILAASFLMLVGFGAKAGMFPLHGWLPTAHPAAPSPASAVLSGVITKAGVLGVARLITSFIGVSMLRGSWVQTAFMVLALFTIFMGSLLAYREQLLKKRLAYSTVSQVSYILLGMSTMHPLGLVGALLHVVCHSLIKDVLFMCAGGIILKTGKTRVADLEGIGRQMPITMWCFTLASVGLVGIPPCMGFISKWYLAQGALSMTGVASWLNYAAPAVLLVSALLTAGYLLPIVIQGFLPSKAEDGSARFFAKCEASWSMLIPLITLTALSVLCGMFPNMFISLFSGLATVLM